MSVKRDFSGRVALITGSSSGIGAQTAIDFSRSGAHVVVTGRNAKNLSDVAKKCLEVSPKKLKPLEVVADVCKEEDCRGLIDSTIKEFGRLDILVNNAAAPGVTSIDDKDLMEKFDYLITANLRSVVYLTQLAVKHLEKTKGNIINISSVGGIKPAAMFSVYCMTKAALDMFTRSMALELGPKGIRVNVVNPAAVRTNFGRELGLDQAQFQKVVDDHGKSYPLGRAGESQDISSAILYLASDESSWVTGINLICDGGGSNAPMKEFKL